MRSLRVLVVDDDPDVGRLATFSLERIGGFRVQLVTNGDDALAAVARETPDVVLLDVMIPGTDGPSILRALRRLPAAATLPVLFITATSSAAECARLVALGGAGVIAKPLNVSELPKRVRAMVEGAGVHDAAAMTQASSVDDALTAAREAFKRRLRDKLDELDRLSATGAWESLRRLAHRLRGSAATYGFAGVGGQAAAVEEVLLACKCQPDDAARDRIRDALGKARAGAGDES
jgi:DNA-binding response OmpR family regulator